MSQSRPLFDPQSGNFLVELCLGVLLNCKANVTASVVARYLMAFLTEAFSAISRYIDIL